MKESAKKVLLLVAKSHDEISLFTVYRRSGLPFAVFIKDIKELETAGYIVVEDDQISLTREGISEAQSLEKERNLVIKKFWREVPARFLREPLESREKYLPHRPRFKPRRKKEKDVKS